MKSFITILFSGVFILRVECVFENAKNDPSVPEVIVVKAERVRFEKNFILLKVPNRPNPIKITDGICIIGSDVKKNTAPSPFSPR